MTPVRLEFEFDATDTSEDKYLPDRIMGMFALAFKVVIPNYTNTINTVVNVYDSDDALIYTSGNLTQNATKMVFPWTTAAGTVCPLVRKAKVNITLSGAAGSGGGTVQLAIFSA